MTQQITHFTRQIRDDLPRAEADVDVAMLSLSTLLSTLVAARIKTGVNPGTGQRAVAEVVKAQQAMVDASGALAKAHLVMRKVGTELGGHDIDECPPSHGSQLKPLRIVA
jgi:hypothetical protein